MRSKRLLIWFPVVFLPVSNLITGVPGTLSVEWLIGAVVEELFFRIFLLRTILLPRVKPILAILLVSILFAGMHLFNMRAGQPLDQTLLQMGCAFTFGIWAGAVTWKASFLIPILAHILMNATAGEEVLLVSMAVCVVLFIDGVIIIRMHFHGLRQYDISRDIV